jgi:hypothetical protein
MRRNERAQLGGSVRSDFSEMDAVVASLSADSFFVSSRGSNNDWDCAGACNSHSQTLSLSLSVAYTCNFSMEEHIANEVPAPSTRTGSL